jgi:hypothetical protein
MSAEVVGTRDNLHHYCSLFVAGELSAEDRAQLRSRTRAAMPRGMKWEPGAVITVRFLSGAPVLQRRVRAAAQEWMRHANLTLDFRTAAPTDIRIAFVPGDGSWSFVGTTCRLVEEPEPTMNFGWLRPRSPKAELRRVVLHEFGHALGLIHEHQNPVGGIRWNRDAVIKDLSGPPNNWSLETIESNLFEKYEPGDLDATSFDPQSIMLYPIPAAWTEDGRFSVGLNGELSAKDKSFVAEQYPA